MVPCIWDLVKGGLFSVAVVIVNNAAYSIQKNKPVKRISIHFCKIP
jgi:hypothetical protein